MFDINEVCSYLRAKPDEKLIDDILRIGRKLEKAVYKKHIISEFYVKIENSVVFIGNIGIESKNLSELLENSDKCIILAGTMGIQLDKAILFQSKVSVYDGVIADAVGSAMIEKYVDEIQAELLKKYILTRRYGTGYGDFKLEKQKDILTLLDAQKRAGIYLNKGNLMLPRKSVSAIMGIGKETKPFDVCRGCLIDCEKRGAGCGGKNTGS